MMSAMCHGKKIKQQNLNSKFNCLVIEIDFK